jgi:hypothetical protein
MIRSGCWKAGLVESAKTTRGAQTIGELERAITAGLGGADDVPKTRS